MTARVRTSVAVGAAALAAAALVVGVTLATRQDPRQPKAQPGKPPALFVTGVDSPAAAEIRRAFRSWPGDSLRRLEALGRTRPRDPVVQFNLGIARFWAGYTAEAAQAWRVAKRRGRDTQYEVRADNLLHPSFFTQGYPIFVPERDDPALQEGVLLQRQGHQHSAERVYARVARARPHDAEAQVAAAVARFDEDELAASFSRLGPLVRRFPRSQSVRYHLGLLLAWTGQRQGAVAQFTRARALGPKTRLGREANAFLRGLGR
jgi:hypothetical protein